MTILKSDVVRNYRGRRFMLCRILDDLEDIIDHLGNNETLNPPEEGLRASPEKALKNELKNQATNLIRTILVHNDGGPASGLRYKV